MTKTKQIIEPPKRPEIDHRTIKLLVGVIAISLAPLTGALTNDSIKSISAAYHLGGWAQNVFVGLLFAVSALMLGFNGETKAQMLMSKAAAVAGFGIALFPCDCDQGGGIAAQIHDACSVVMFGILTYFCYAFYWLAKKKVPEHPRAVIRARIYAVCGVAILAAIVVLAIDKFTDKALQAIVPRLVFYGEGAGLLAFGISWLTASRTVPVITGEEERFSPLRAENPE